MNRVGYCAGSFVFHIRSPKSKHERLKNERSIHLPKSVRREMHGVAFGKRFVGLLKLFCLICSLRANSPGEVKFWLRNEIAEVSDRVYKRDASRVWKRMQIEDIVMGISYEKLRTWNEQR